MHNSSSLLLSDGQHTQSAMLATQLNGLVANGQIQPLCLIHLVVSTIPARKILAGSLQQSLIPISTLLFLPQEFICNEIQNRKIIIVLKMEVRSGPIPKIGDPVEFAKDEKPVPMQQGEGGGGGGSSYNQGPGSLNTMQGSAIPPPVSQYQ